MKDYHCHQAVPQGGYLCSCRIQDWPAVAAADGMTACFGQHPYHASEVEPAELAFALDDWLQRYPQADVGECGLDASDKWKSSLETQRLILQIQIGAAFRHGRMLHLHGVHAWAELLAMFRERERNGTLPKLLLHAWNGSHEMAREFLKLGAIFSVGLRELQSPKAAERYARIPADKLFPESDDHPENFGRCLALLHLLRGDIPGLAEHHG